MMTFESSSEIEARRKANNSGSLGVTAVRPEFTTLQLGMGASRERTTGTDRYFLDLLRRLPALGVGVHGLCVGEPEKLDDPVANVSGFAPFGAPRLSRWRCERRAVRDLVDRANMVVSHGSFVAFPVLDLIRGLPMVAQFHGPWALESRAEGRSALTYHVRRFQEALSYRQADRFIVLSRAFGEILSQQYKVPWDRIRVVPGGVALERFALLPSRSEAREILNWPLDRPIVVTARRLVPSKGVDRLIDAIAGVRNHVPDIFCAIAGTGRLADDLQRRIDEKDLRDHVRLLGYVSDQVLSLVYRAADLFTVPTVALEGFGLVVVEALACGTPAIVTPIGGLGEVVSDLEPNLVLQGATAADIANGIVQAFDGSAKLPTAEACIEYSKRFDWNIIAAKVSQVYREIL